MRPRFRDARRLDQLLDQDRPPAGWRQCSGAHHPGRPHDWWATCSGSSRSYAEHRSGVAA